MLKVTFPGGEYWDEKNQIFITVKPQTLTLEHSLVSLSRWEAKWKVPYFDRKRKQTPEQAIDYIRCMCLTQNVDPMVFQTVTPAILKEISDYINDNQTATWFRKEDAKPSREIITSEVIYQQMIALEIPFECQKWHLSRLFTLIRVCAAKAKPPEKLKGQKLAQRNAALNRARRKPKKR